jgi:hypothetical protein
VKWSRASQRMAAKLQEIERVRKQAAEARLLDARAASDEAERARLGAEGVVADAEQAWNAHLTSRWFDPGLGRAFAADILMQERALDRCRVYEQAQADELERQRDAWRRIEASVRSGERRLRRGRSKLLKAAEARREQELSDRTSWRWFSR